MPTAPKWFDPEKVKPLSYWESLPDPVQLVEGTLIEGEKHMIFGLHNLGKTQVVLHMMAALAAGQPWFGRATSQRNVWYVAAEGGDKVMVNRLRAVEQHFGLPATTDDNFLVYPAPVQITDPEGMHEALDILYDMTGVKYQVVVFDTMNINLGAEDAGNNSEMRALISSLTDLSQHTFPGDDDPTPVTPILLHHTGWADQTRPKEAQQIAGGMDQIYGMAAPQAFNTIAKSRDKVPTGTDDELAVMWAYKQRNMDKSKWDRKVFQYVVPMPITGSEYGWFVLDELDTMTLTLLKHAEVEDQAGVRETIEALQGGKWTPTKNLPPAIVDSTQRNRVKQKLPELGYYLEDRTVGRSKEWRLVPVEPVSAADSPPASEEGLVSYE